MTNHKVVKKKRYDQEFRMDTAKMIVEGGRRASDVARDLGITAQSVSAWVKRYNASKEKLEPVLSMEGLKLKAALEENRKLKIQVDFLKKTMAYFVELPK
jgi:transposase